MNVCVHTIHTCAFIHMCVWIRVFECGHICTTIIPWQSEVSCLSPIWDNVFVSYCCVSQVSWTRASGDSLVCLPSCGGNIGLHVCMTVLSFMEEHRVLYIQNYISNPRMKTKILMQVQVCVLHRAWRKQDLGSVCDSQGQQNPCSQSVPGPFQSISYSLMNCSAGGTVFSYKMY